MAQIHIADRQNPLLFQMDMNAEVSTLRQQTTRNLGRTYMASSQEYEDVLDETFIMLCRQIATGYAWQRNIMAETGRSTFKTAVRRDQEFQARPESRKKVIYREMKHISSIVNNWQSIQHNCSLPWMNNVDVRTFPLWISAKCKNYTFIEKENQKDGSRKREHPTAKEYNLEQVQDVVDNKPGATEAILDQVDRDLGQIDMICDDIKIEFHRRALRLS